MPDPHDKDDLAALLGRLAGSLPELTERLTAHGLTAGEAGADAQRLVGILRYLEAAQPRPGSVPGPLDLQVPLKKAIEVTEPEIRLSAALTVELGPTPQVFGDEHALVQVFIHLLVNAVQAGADKIGVWAFTNEMGHAVVEIADSGSGIDEDTLQHIFEPFFTTKAGRGMGLGLTICQATLAAFGGTVTVESTVGRGSLFRVTMRPA